MIRTAAVTVLVSFISVTNANAGIGLSFNHLLDAPTNQTSLQPELPAMTDVSIRSCIESVCGPASKNQSGYDTLEARRSKPKLYSRIWSEVYLPKLESALANQAMVDSVASQLLEDEHAQFEFSAEQEKTYRYILSTIMLAMGEFANLKSAFIFDPKTRLFTLDENKLKSLLKAYNPAKAEALRYLVPRVLLGLRNEISLTKFSSQPLKSYLQSSHPGITLDKARSILAHRFLSDYRDVEVKLGPAIMFLLEGGKPLAEKAASSQKLTTPEESDLLSARLVLNLLKVAINPETQKRLETLAEPLGVLLAKAKQADGLKKFKSRLLVAGSENWKKTLNRCEAQFSQMMEMDAGRLRRLKKQIEVLKVGAKSVAFRYVKDSANEKKMENAIDAIEFNLSPTGSVRLRNFREDLARNAQTHMTKASVLKVGDRESRNLILFSFVAAFTQQDTSDKTEAQKLCDKYASTLVADAALQEEGRIDVSWFTSVTPEVGAGIVAHEIGHIVSARLRGLESEVSQSTRFGDSLSCVGNRNPNNKSLIPAGTVADSSWSEEDWADRFSSAVIKDLKIKGLIVGKKNFACSLVVDYGDEYPINENKIEPADGDTHSSGFLRLLMISHDQGETSTPQCRPLSDALASTGRPLTCQ